MKQWRISIFCAIILVMISAPLTIAQYHSGGRGLMYVHTARTLEKGDLNAYFHSRFYGKTADVLSVSTTYWSVQGSFALNYGLNEQIELSIIPIIYQDTNSSPHTYNVPHDVFLKFKIGSLGEPSSRVKHGVLITGRIPLGKSHNVVYEPYSAGTVEVGFTGITSYSSDVLFPEESFNFDFNLGFILHNDSGNKLTDAAADTFSNSGTSSQFSYGLGFRYPFDKWRVSFEINGNFFINKPVATAYSRENYLYATPGLGYKISNWLELVLGADFRISSDEDETDYQFIGELPKELPRSYPDWRVQTGMKVSFFPSATYRNDERDILVKRAESRREVFEQIVREQRETEKAEHELARIKVERVKAEKELARLKKLLEEDDRKKDDKPRN